MPNAVGVRTQLLRIAESTWGVTPATPNMTKTRYTQADLGAAIDFVESKEIRSDRMTSDYRQGVLSGKGSIDAELISGCYDDLLAALMGNTWQASTVTMTGGPSVAVDGTLLTFTRSLGSFPTDGFAVGQLVTTAGFTNGGNNGTFVITALTATVMTCANEVGLTTEGSAAGRTIVNTNNVLKAGSLVPSFSLEQGYLDIAQYELMTGAVVDKFSLSAKASQIVTCKFDLLGKAYSTSGASVASQTTLPNTYSPMDTFSGTIKEGGTTIATITAIDLQVDNNSELAKVVGTKNLADLRFGRSKITGKISAYFQDFSLITKFLNETVSSLDFTLAGIPSAKTLEFNLPKIKYTGQSNPVNKETLLMQDLQFVALVDPLTLTNLLMTRVP